MQEVLIFSGTSEGRTLAELLSAHSIAATVCVATEYGQEVMRESDLITVRVGRMNQEEMERLIQSRDWLVVIDATHPYAREVTENIKRACEGQGREVLRLLRSRTQRTNAIPAAQIHYVNSAEEAASHLNEMTGNIFLTTGSKELSKYMELIQEKERIFVRILPGTEELEKCHELGLKGRQIICMQGPFSEELNLAMMKEVKAEWLVTKETAGAGGYPEKLRAAERAGAQVIVIKRPEETGYSMEEIIEKLGISEKTGISEEMRIFREMKISEDETGFPVRKIALVGIGMGNRETLTVEACQTIKEAQLLIGAVRMIEAIPEELKKDKEQFISYQTQEIISYIQNHPRYEKIAVLFSGDVGFYSGANHLLKQLKEHSKEQMEGQAKEGKVQEKLTYQIKLICGISSAIYFASKLQMPWEDMKLMSLHGRSQNVIGALHQNEKVFTLTKGAEGIRTLCSELIRYGMEHVKIYLGRQLGSLEEEKEEGSPKDFKDYEKEGLCVLVLVNERAGENVITHGIPDEKFLRGKVPMTKEEVRSISISKLGLKRDSVVWDIGAGTGSISVECAKIAVDGSVYAIEKKQEACKLIEENKYKLAVSNLQIIAGEAPDVLRDLPVPTHAFIGGSSGKLEVILKNLWEKNSDVRVVLNAISLETISEIATLLKKYDFSQKEIVQVTIAKAKEIGNYQMMMGQNPVYVVTLQR